MGKKSLFILTTVVTLLIISSIFAGISTVFGGVGLYIALTNSLRARRMDEKEEELQNAITTQYSCNAARQHFMKLVCILHLVRDSAKQTYPISFSGGDAVEEFLYNVCLDRVEVEFDYKDEKLKCRCYFQPTQLFIHCTFDSVVTRGKFERYLAKTSLAGLQKLCLLSADDVVDWNVDWKKEKVQ